MGRIVALHGFTGSGADFDPLRPLLPAQTELIAPDFPGHGHKAHQRRASEYALESHLQLISEAVGPAEPVTLLGYSMGGRLALHWSVAHPERVRRLILIGASPGLPEPAQRDERRLADADLANFIRTQGLPAFFKYWYNQTFFASLMALPPERLDPILSRRAENQPEALALSLENVGTGTLPSLWHRLKELRMPIDIVTGKHDVKFTRVAHEMGAHLPKARLSVVEHAGHAVHLEQPADLAMLL